MRTLSLPAFWSGILCYLFDIYFDFWKVGGVLNGVFVVVEFGGVVEC